MLTTVLVVAFTLAAAVTDLLWHKIHNSITYPGILSALVLNAVASATGLASQGDHPTDQWLGWVGLADSAAGLAVCGFLMVVLYVFFRIGGGDVKLLAMLGAFLGLEKGIETLLWTFVLGGALGVVVLIWRVGLWTLLKRVFRHVWSTLRFGFFSSLTEEERRELQMPLFLAPTALAALLIVRFRLLDYLNWQFAL